MGINFFGFDSVPIFTIDLGGSGPTEAPPSQVKLFDVYYLQEPIVGIHVLGGEEETPDSPGVAGFLVIGED